MSLVDDGTTGTTADGRVVEPSDEPISSIGARTRYALRVLGIVASWLLALVVDLATKLLRIAQRVLVLWQIYAVMLVLLIVGAVIIGLQTEIQQVVDVVYDCGVYKLVDALLRNLLLPFVRVPYEFVVVRLNDGNIYVRQCVSQFVAALLGIDNLLTAGGLVDAFCAFVDFVADCLIKFVTDICSWRIPFVSETLQNALNIFPCSLRFAKGVVAIIVYVIESAVAAEFDFVVFKQLCGELVAVFSFCASNVLELFTLENTIGPLLEYVAENPFTIDFGGGTVFNSTVLLPASFDHSASFVPVLTDGLLALSTCVFVFAKNTFVSVVTGTIIANEAYVCRRLNYCEADGKYPWYVPPLFIQVGAARVTEATVLYDDGAPVVEELFAVLVPNRRYSRERYPRNELLDVLSFSNAASEVRAVQHAVFTPTRLLDNCAMIAPPILNDTEGGEVPVAVPCGALDPAELARSYTIVVRTRYRRSGVPVVGTRQRFEFNPDNTTYTAGDVGAIVEPPPSAFAFAQSAFPEPNVPRAVTFRIDEAPLAEQPVVRCDATVSFFGQLFECLFAALDVVVTTFVAAANFFAQIGAIASGGGAGDATPFADLGVVDETLEQLRGLIQEDATRPFCRIGVANALTFKPSLYAALRLTDCDTADIGALWQADTFDDGLIGCTLAFANVFAEPDFTDPVQFFKFLIVALGQQTVGGAVVLVVNSFTCLGRPDVVECVNQFPVYTADTNTTGSCTAVLADIEDDDDDDDNGVNDRPLGGLGGCIKLWRGCVRDESAAVPSVDANGTSGALAAFNTFAPLFDAAVGFGTDFLDPIVCPFIVADYCGRLANLDPMADVACPIPLALPPADGDRNLLCRRFAMCCWLGQDVGVNGTNLLPGNATYEIEFVGTGWLEIIGLLGKGTIDLVIFVASFDDAVRDIFNVLTNIFTIPQCELVPCTVNSIATLLQCQVNFLTMFLPPFLNVCIGGFPSRFNITQIIDALPVPPDLGALGAELNRRQPIGDRQPAWWQQRRDGAVGGDGTLAMYALPPYDEVACADGVVGDAQGSAPFEQHAAHEAYLNYALRAEHALIASGTIDDLWSDTEFAVTFADWRRQQQQQSVTGGNGTSPSPLLSHICAFYGTQQAARVVYMAEDGEARMHLFRSRTLSSCVCASANATAWPFDTPPTLESLLLNVPLFDATGALEAYGESVIEMYATCECDLGYGQRFSLRNVTRAYYTGLVAAMFSDVEAFPPGSTCAEAMQNFDALAPDAPAQRRAMVTLSWCALAARFSAMLHEHNPERYSRSVLLGDSFVAISAVVDFFFSQFGGLTTDAFASANAASLTRRRASTLHSAAPAALALRDGAETNHSALVIGSANGGGAGDIHAVWFGERTEGHGGAGEDGEGGQWHISREHTAAAAARRAKMFEQRRQQRRQQRREAGGNGRYGPDLHLGGAAARVVDEALQSAHGGIAWFVTAASNAAAATVSAAAGPDAYATRVGSFLSRGAASLARGLARASIDRARPGERRSAPLPHVASWQVVAAPSSSSSPPPPPLLHASPSKLRRRQGPVKRSLPDDDNDDGDNDESGVGDRGERSEVTREDALRRYFEHFAEYIRRTYHERDMHTHLAQLARAWRGMSRIIGASATTTLDKAPEALAYAVEHDDYASFHRWLHGKLRYVDERVGFVDAAVADEHARVRSLQYRDPALSLADVVRGHVRLRARHQALGPSLALGRWAHARRVRASRARLAEFERQYAQQNAGTAAAAEVALRKRSLSDSDDGDSDDDGGARSGRGSAGLEAYRLADERRARHITAHVRYAGNMERQRRALRDIVARGAYAYNASEAAEYERHVQCRSYLDARRHGGLVGYESVQLENAGARHAFRALPDAEQRERFCTRLFAELRAHTAHDTTHGHLHVELDDERYFYHRYISVAEFRRAHLARGSEHVRALLRRRVLAAIASRSGVTRVTRAHIDNVYATGDFARTATEAAAAFGDAVARYGANSSSSSDGGAAHWRYYERRHLLHARQQLPPGGAALNTARAIAEPIFVFTLNVTFELVNACVMKKGGFNATTYEPGADFVADVLVALFGAEPLRAPTSFEDAFASVVEALDALVDGVAALFADPVAHIETTFDALLELVVCDIPGDFDGSGGYYNPFCLAAGFLPEALFVDVLEPLPTGALPKQVPWPAALVAQRTANVRIVDEGSGMLFDNDRFNDCVRAADPDPLDANAVPPCELCDDVFDDDDDVLASKCTPNGTLDVGWRRDVRLFSAITETGALLLELIASGTLPPDAADFTLDPNSNCNVTADEFGVPIPRPFCGQCDYTPGAYESCRDDLGWDDVGDSWLFFAAKLPVLLNRLLHPRSLLDIGPLLLVVFPLPYTLYVPEFEVAALLWTAIDALGATLRLTDLATTLLTAIVPAIVSVAAWATRFLGLVSTAINIIPILGPAIALLTTALEYTVALVLRALAIVSVLLAVPLRTWLGRYYFVHLSVAGAVWLLAQCIEFGTLQENALLKLLCDALFYTKDTTLALALGLAEPLAALAERAQRYKAPVEPADVFCFYWTAQNWIAGWLLFASVALLVRLLVFGALRVVAITFTLVRESTLQTERLAGIRAFNRSLRNESAVRAVASVAMALRARLGNVERLRLRRQSVAIDVGGSAGAAAASASASASASVGAQLADAANESAQLIGGPVTPGDLDALELRQRRERHSGAASQMLVGARLRAHVRQQRRESWLYYYVVAPLRRLARIGGGGGGALRHAHRE